MWYLYSVHTVYNVQTKARERGSRDFPNIDIFPHRLPSYNPKTMDSILGVLLMPQWIFMSH